MAEKLAARRQWSTNPGDHLNNRSVCYVNETRYKWNGYPLVKICHFGFYTFSNLAFKIPQPNADS